MKSLTAFVCLATACFHRTFSSIVPPKSHNSGFLIIGGNETQLEEHRFTVGLRNERNSSNFCGGALIDRTHVLTAAHCLWFNPSYVSLGSHFLKGDVDGQYVEIKNRIVHPKFGKPKFMSNDLAILELMEPAHADIPTIQLASELLDDEPIGIDSTVCGWGYTTEDGKQSDVKLKVTVPIISNEQCFDSVGDGLDDSMICAGFSEGGKDACQYDSGGPLFSFVSDKPKLIGIVSWGQGCASENSPGVYARVSHALDFIKDTIPSFV